MEDKINTQLIDRCINGNRDGQFKLYNLMLPYLNAICKRYLTNTTDLKDVLQDTFISLFKNLHKFNPKKASIKTWTTTIAINNCLKYNAKNAKKPTEQLIADIHSTPITPVAFENITIAEILSYLKQMPQPQYEVFNLYVIDEFSHKEISLMLGIKTSLSRKRLSRARTWIKERIESDSEFHFNFALL
ncbi:MAG: RNA polymerase sigma factor [Aureispira sp.]